MTYFFPDETLSDCSDAELFQRIDRLLPQALYMVDGTDGISDVHVDYAQDTIEQARDILLQRQCSFCPELRSKLDFLDWRTPLEKERDKAEKSATEVLLRQKQFQAQSAMDTFVGGWSKEVLSYLSPVRHSGGTLVARRDCDQFWLSVSGTATAACVQQYQSRLQQLLAEDFSCYLSPFVEGWEKKAYFHLKVPILQDGRMYAILRNLLFVVQDGGIKVHSKKADVEAWSSVTRLFARSREPQAA